MSRLSSRSKLKLTRLSSVVKTIIILSHFIPFVNGYEHMEISTKAGHLLAIGFKQYTLRRLTTGLQPSCNLDLSGSTIPQLSNSTCLPQPLIPPQVNFYLRGTLGGQSVMGDP